MPEYSRPLGDAVKRARARLQMTQSELASSIDVDSRTILNIENYKGNPKMEVLYPLLRALKVDAREIFTPELFQQSSAHSQLRVLLEECNEQEAEVLIPIFVSILNVMRSKERRAIK